MIMFTLQFSKKNIQKRLFYGLSALFVLTVILYAHFLNETVTNVVERQATQEKIAELSSEVSELEFAYIQKQNEITLRYARKLGFREVSDPNYVVKGSSADALTMLDNQQ